MDKTQLAEAMASEHSLDILLVGAVADNSKRAAAAAPTTFKRGEMADDRSIFTLCPAVQSKIQEDFNASSSSSSSNSSTESGDDGENDDDAEEDGKDE
ncbi:hypothetical protein BG003_006654 [Podila horticola]|nr:hypothetical protein BG003_006654 [Podila horticola]